MGSLGTSGWLPTGARPIFRTRRKSDPTAIVYSRARDARRAGAHLALRPSNETNFHVAGKPAASVTRGRGSCQ